MVSSRVRVLFVCLGNICRSPLAEGVFLSLVRSRGLDPHYEVDSAGTGSWHVGERPDARSVEVARVNGVELRGAHGRSTPETSPSSTTWSRWIART